MTAHHQIEQDEVRLLLTGDEETGRAAVSLDHAVVTEAQGLGQDAAEEVVIIYDEDLGCDV